jgi:hypothetical protein
MNRADGVQGVRRSVPAQLFARQDEVSEATDEDSSAAATALRSWLPTSSGAFVKRVEVADRPAETGWAGGWVDS